jgi:hypothetical protein
MREIIRISRDSLCEFLYQIDYDRDLTGESHYFTFNPDEKQRFQRQFFDKVLSDPEVTERAYFCPECRLTYEEDSGREYCLDCLDEMAE